MATHQRVLEVSAFCAMAGAAGKAASMPPFMLVGVPSVEIPPLGAWFGKFDILNCSWLAGCGWAEQRRFGDEG